MFGFLAAPLDVFSGVSHLENHGVEGFGEQVDFAIAGIFLNRAQVAFSHLSRASCQLKHGSCGGAGKHERDGNGDQNGQQHRERERDRVDVAKRRTRKHEFLIVSIAFNEINGVLGHGLGHDLRELKISGGLQRGVGVHRHDAADAQRPFAFGLFAFKQIDAVFGTRLLQLGSRRTINDCGDGGREGA